MRRSALLAATAVLLAACGADPLPAEDVLVRVDADVAEIESGSGFPLTVTREWRRDHVPEEWDDDALAPLRLVLLATERREDAERVLEVRRFRAHAFGAGETTVGPVEFRARPRAGGPALAATAPALQIAVTPALVPGDPGPPELPGGLRREPSAWPLLLAAAAALAGALLFLRRRRRPAAPAPPPPPAGPEPARDPALESALARLSALRDAAPGGPEQIAAFHGEAAAILRDYAAARFALPAGTSTSEELSAAAAPRAPGDDRLREVLAAADLVKFARDLPGGKARERLLDAAEGFVRATSPGAPA